MTESNIVEFKREYVSDLYKEIIAFANTSGGTIYVGIEDDGTVCGVDNINDVQIKCTDNIKDNIKPDVMAFVDIKPVVIEGKNVLQIAVNKGSMAPYYAQSKGIRPEGVFVRRGTASTPATQTEILNMIKDVSTAYEDARSLEQNLTFIEAERQFESAGLPFGEAQQRSLGIIGRDGCYTNLAYLLSDQCGYKIKFAVFDGQTKEVFRDRHEFTGSLFRQIDDVTRIIDSNNRLSSPKINGVRREDYRDYPVEAIREALLNAVVHRDYAMNGDTLISMFSDRIEFISLGGLVRGVEMADVMIGVSYLRNRKLADIFYRLHLIEAYGTGIAKIKKSYEGQRKQPVFECGPNSFKVVLYKTENLAVMPESYTESDIPKAERAGREAEIQKFVAEHGGIVRRDVEKLFNVSSATATRILSKMVGTGKLKRVGDARNVKYIW